MADLCRAVAGALLLMLLPAGVLAAPVGDFGRPAPNVVNDVLLPALGAARAHLAGEPVSDFARSDAEIDLANWIYRFEFSPHASDWVRDQAAEIARTRLLAGTPSDQTIGRYYEWLHTTAYRSASVRYTRMDDDIVADLAMLPAAFSAACSVVEVDRERQKAAANLPSLDPAATRDVAARVAENQQEIGGFVRSLRYRYESYNYALEHLLVETPDPAARVIDDALAELGAQVLAAENGDFCLTSDTPHPGNAHPHDSHAGPAPRARFEHDGSAAPRATGTAPNS